MMKKQRRKKLSTPSKTEGSAVQAEGEVAVGSSPPTPDPHPCLPTPALAPVEQDKRLNLVLDCHYHCT